MRFTGENIQKILDVNEGFKARTYYKSRNKEEENLYRIMKGELQKRSIGKTSFGGSRYDKTTVCDLKQTREFLKKNIEKLNLNVQ